MKLSVLTGTFIENIRLPLMSPLDVQKAAVHSVISSMSVFPLNFESAGEGGLIFSARKQKGRTVDPEDAIWSPGSDGKCYLLP